MKLSNFVLEETIGSCLSDRAYLASVDVETGFFFWKKKTKRKIRREYGSYWYFVDSGEFVPGFQAENLARAWTAQTGEQC